MAYHSLHGQVIFIIDSLPANTPEEDTIYIAGDFNGWQPGSIAYALQKNKYGQWQIALEKGRLKDGIQFKFTLGDWNYVEKDKNGLDIENRQYHAEMPDTVNFVIQQWAKGITKKNTASPNVIVLAHSFSLEPSIHDRTIRFYLPPDYNEATVSYPVIYMHDGQNLFDEKTAFSGEWKVDETLDKLFAEGYHVPIVVGIDHGEKNRIDELTPWPNPKYGGGNGDFYLEFVTKVLKPFIDENYRTQPGPKSTCTWGSSLGGLFSFYAIFSEPNIFGKAGIFSPSYWYADSSLKVFLHNSSTVKDIKLYQSFGSEEGDDELEDFLEISDSIQKLDFDDESFRSVIVSGGKHEEKWWAEQFEPAYLWLFHLFANGIEEDLPTLPLNYSYDSSRDEFIVKDLKPDNLWRLLLVDENWATVKDEFVQVGQPVQMKPIKPGKYTVEIITPNILYRGQLILE